MWSARGQMTALYATDRSASRRSLRDRVRGALAASLGGRLRRFASSPSTPTRTISLPSGSSSRRSTYRGRASPARRRSHRAWDRGVSREPHSRNRRRDRTLRVRRVPVGHDQPVAQSASLNCAVTRREHWKPRSRGPEFSSSPAPADPYRRRPISQAPDRPARLAGPPRRRLEQVAEHSRGPLLAPRSPLADKTLRGSRRRDLSRLVGCPDGIEYQHERSVTTAAYSRQTGSGRRPPTAAILVADSLFGVRDALGTHLPAWLAALSAPQRSCHTPGVRGFLGSGSLGALVATMRSDARATVSE